MAGGAQSRLNQIPYPWVTHKLENNNTKEVLPLLVKVLSTMSGFTALGSDKETGNLQGIWPWRFSSVQFSRSVQLFATPWTAAHQPSLFITNSWSLLKFMSIESVMPSNHPILCCPILFQPSIFHSIRVFSSESVLCIRWPKYWSFTSASVLAMNIQDWFPLRMDRLDLLAVQGTLKSLLQHHSSKVSIFWHSPHFTVQLLYPYMTTGKTISLTRWTFVSKVQSLLFNMLSRLVISFLLRCKSLNFIAAVTICSDSEDQENNVSHCSHCFPIYLSWSDGTRCHDLSFLNAEF